MVWLQHSPFLTVWYFCCIAWCDVQSTLQYGILISHYCTALLTFLEAPLISAIIFCWIHWECSLLISTHNNSNLRCPPQKTSANRKCIYPNLRWPSKNKMSAMKKYFTIYFIHLKHKSSQILSTFTNQCHSFHLHSQCLYLPHTSS
jgi:hypothetical protein